MNWLEKTALKIALRRFLKGEQMGAILAFLRGRKTYITGAVSIVMSLLSLVGVGVPGLPMLGHDTAVQTIVTSLLGIFIRNGVATSVVPK